MTVQSLKLLLALFLLISFTASAQSEPDEVLPPSTFLNSPPETSSEPSATISEEDEKHPMDWSKTLVSRDIAGRNVTLDNAGWEKQYQDGQSAYFFGLYQRAQELWVPLARAGHADAQASLGWLYESGLLGKKDLEQALHWYQQAAAQQQPVAQNNLGVFYEQGKVVSADREKALQLYRQSAQQHYRFGQYNLGALLAKGDVKQRREAVTWLRAAAAQGVKRADAVLKNLSEK